eukprot:TRINITY_DN3243_c0_g1_i2.p2 TRINITY_DN3243_c0_g1~~TRINITY_DN3243_c0_g1_i2.p2  ORF type:complete len:103 (-),score=32.72 TRINITY_DN3243_c0_g1_i2:40-348(-)
MNDVKVVLLGHTNVGKTSLALRFVENVFYEANVPTIGASFFSKNIVMGNNKLKLQIWDTAGQEKFKTLVPMYYRDAKAAILVYDITNVFSFERVKELSLIHI